MYLQSFLWSYGQKRVWRLLATCVIVLPATIASGQDVAVGPATSSDHVEQLPPDELFRSLTDADRAFRAFDYPSAAKLYERITERNPYNGDYWMRLARCQVQLKDYDKAIVSMQRALDVGDDSPPGQTQHQIAVLHTRQGDVKSAIDWLEKSMRARHEHRSSLSTDTRFDSLRSDPRFAAVAGTVVDTGKLSRAEQWSRDLDYLVEEAARMHPLWHEGDRAEQFREAAEILRGRIADLTDEQLLVEMQKTIVLLRDGHSRVQTPGKVPATPRLPLVLHFFSDGLFVTDAADAYRDLVGCRIDKIGKVTPPEAERLLAQIVSRDNPMGIKANGAFSLVNPQRLHSLGIIEDTTKVRLEVTDPARKQRVVDVEPDKPLAQSRNIFPSKLPAAAEPPLYMRRINENLWFEALPEIDGVYVQFNEVSNQAGRQIVDVARALREYLVAHPTKVLVLDVRHNGGGNTYLYLPLLKALMHYELIQPEGRIFAIIGRHTFSAAQNFTNDVDRLTGAIFIGEPTGSRPSFVGESTQVVLPYSGVGLSISTRIHAHAYATDRRIWIAPDVPAELSSSDYFANRDPAMAAIRAIVNKK